MNSKVKIFIGVLVVGVILISGWWIWNKPQLPSFYQLPAKTEISADITKLDFDEFYNQVILNQNNELYFAGKINYLLWQWTPHGIHYGFEERLPIVGNIDDSWDNNKQIIAYGYLKNITVEMPEFKSRSPKMVNITFRVFHIEDAIPMNFSYLKCPKEVVENSEFDVNLTFSNPFFQPIKVYFFVEGSGAFRDILEMKHKNFYTFNSKESRDFKWRLKAAKSGYGDIIVSIFGINNKGIIWMRDSCRLEVLGLPKIAVYCDPKADSINEYLIYRSGESKKIQFKIANIGDLPAYNISVKIILPNNVTATKTEWKINKLIGGEEIILSTVITSIREENFIVDIEALDKDGNGASGSIYFELEK